MSSVKKEIVKRYGSYDDECMSDHLAILCAEIEDALRLIGAEDYDHKFIMEQAIRIHAGYLASGRS